MDQLSKKFLLFITTVSIAVIGLQMPAIIKARASSYDEQVSSDLSDINKEISAYELKDGNIPQTLSDVTVKTVDSNRMSRYDYKPNSYDGSYELCATFKTKSSNQDSKTGTELATSYQDYTVHDKGHQCFKVKSYSSEYNYNETSSSGSSSTSTVGTGGALGSIQQKSDDVVIKTNINSLQAHLEAYYADTGYYPTLAQLKDANWRSVNMVGLDDESINGPNGYRIGSGYDYVAQPANCKGSEVPTCDSFTISAKLSDNTMYTKRSLE